MSEVVIQSVEAGLTALFQHVYEANCELEGEAVTSEDRVTLSELSPLETLENLKDMIESLLSAKRQLKCTDKAELAERCDLFERLLQKLESEVRTHIRVSVTQVEQQLKLHAEAVQARLEECQRPKDTSSGLGTDYAHHRIASVGADNGFLQLAERKHHTLLQLERECNDLKSVFSLKRAEYERTKGDYERLLREMQLSRIRTGKENVPRKYSALDRAQTDRSKSPYQSTVSKSHLEASEVLRCKVHQRSDSERGKLLAKVCSKPR